MKPIYLVKTGTTFPQTLVAHGDFDQWTAAALGETSLPSKVIDVKTMTCLPPAEGCAAVVITGSHAMVTERLPWSVRLEEWLAQIVPAQVPVFGICYGHQLLAQALAGVTDYHPQGQEIGTVLVSRTVSCDQDPVFRDLPEVFWAHTTHSQSVRQLPPTAVRLAENPFEGNHAFRVGPCAWGVQFHPEYDETIMRCYIEEQRSSLAQRGRQVDELLAGVRATPDAAALMRSFTRYVEERCRQQGAA